MHIIALSTYADLGVALKHNPSPHICKHCDDSYMFVYEIYLHTLTSEDQQWLFDQKIHQQNIEIKLYFSEH